MTRKTTKPKTVHRTLAEHIARDLFTNATGDRADRLLLVQEPNGPRGSVRNDLGGWCEEAAADRIERALWGITLAENKEPA